MDKYLIVHFKENNTRWAIPIEHIAADRARNYAKIDADAGLGTFEEMYRAEYVYSLTDTDELYDWVNNNMDWIDVLDFAFRIADPGISPDYSKWFTNAPKWIGDIEGNRLNE